MKTDRIKINEEYTEKLKKFLIENLKDWNIYGYNAPKHYLKCRKDNTTISIGVWISLGFIAVNSNDNRHHDDKRISTYNPNDFQAILEYINDVYKYLCT